MKKIIFLICIAVFVIVSLTLIILRFQNPDMTSVRFAMEYWWIELIALIDYLVTLIIFKFDL